VFIPTRSLYNIPFSALINPNSNRFLIQDNTIGIAPSVSEFIAAEERDRQSSFTPLASILLVGDPSNSWLPPLPETREEIKQLGRIYQGLDARILLGEEATRSNVLASLPASDIVHMAVHSVQNPKDPSQSGLVLSSNGSDTGNLSARDILGLRLDRTRLVVLASCETQAGPVSASEGSLSIASSFLAAGVPAVVATLWRVEDASTTRISVRFHQELRRGADALSALRTAQLEEIARQRGQFDWTWASFQVLGGVAERAPERF
jgi:CHAT domain-containing protein